MKKNKFTLSAIVTLLIFTAIPTFILSSCSKDDDSPSDQKIKITISSSETFSKAGYADLSITFGTFDGSGKSQKWKINGQETGTETIQRLTNDDFDGGKSFVIESQPSYMTGSVSISGYTNEAPYVLKYKIEQGSKVIAEEEVNMNKDRDLFAKNWQFPQ